MDQYLRVFITVVEKHSFSRAAEELHMTQPAVSQYIKTLERTMGTPLLERTNKFVRLNKAGEVVYHHAKEIMGLHSKMHDLIDDLTNKTSGSLSIGASYSYGEYILPSIITTMQHTYPKINLAITIGNTKEIAEFILNYQLDVGIVEGTLTDRNLVIEPFAIDSMCIVASPSHRLASSDKEVTPQDLEQETWIIREEGSGTREATEKVFSSFEITPKKVLEFGSTQLIKGSLEAGLGISLLSEWVVNKECSNGSLKVIHVKDLSITREFSTVLRSPFQTKALKVFLELLRDGHALSHLRQ